VAWISEADRAVHRRAMHEAREPSAMLIKSRPS